MDTKKQRNRREFIGKTTGWGVGLAAAPYFIAPSVFGANDRIVMGIIGPGGRGRGMMKIFLRLGAEFAAVCDAYKPNAERGLDIAGEYAKSYDDYRDLLNRSDIDAVLIATPEHQHGVQLIDAVEAGKDAYCEKPMSNSIEEGVKMIKAVNDTDRVVQIGMQRRSSKTVLKAKQVIGDGMLGTINLVRAQWHWNASRPLNNSPIPGELDWKAFCYPKRTRPFEPKLFRYWRYFWDFSGGNLTDQGTHLMDVVQWFMDRGESKIATRTPKAAECFGDVYKMIGAETPDVFSAVFEYEEYMATWTLTYTNSYQNGWSILFQGDEGTMVLDGNGFKVYEEPWKSDEPPIVDFHGSVPTDPHVQNFLDCVKSRETPNAPVEVGHTAVCGPHLANAAFHKKRRAYLNEDADRVRT